MGVYELNDLLMPDLRGCSLISQDDIDQSLALEWKCRFIEECDLSPNLDYVIQAKRVLKRHERLKGLGF